MRSAKIVAFHLTQFHPIPENDEWWGEGFTEWTNVRRGRPFFPGHYQPHLPGECGFYDLRERAARERQARQALSHGIDAFCFYYYWFGGKRLLEAPVEAMLGGGGPDIPFLLCWANENWTRRWDGKDREILIAQQHSEEDDRALARDLIRHFRHPLYVHVGERPIMIVYRLDLLPDPAATVRRWKDECVNAGVPVPYLCAVRRFDTPDPARFGFDAVVDFPPHGCVAAQVTRAIPGLEPGFSGRIFDYPDLVRDAMQRQVRHLPNFPGVMPSWDNTARKMERAYLFHGASPLRYRAWLAEAIHRAENDGALPEPLVFINAWNEWAEGCHLEPDQEYGDAWLQATLAARADARRPDRLWQRFAHRQPQLPGSAEIQLAGQPLDRVLEELAGAPCSGPSPTHMERLMALMRRYVEPRPFVRRASLPLARALGLAE